jgi:hypothetical protein
LASNPIGGEAMKRRSPLAISAIVPVYNEETTVSHVVNTLLISPYFSEVICINDGSTDQSWNELKKFRGCVTLIHFSENKGKGQALATGIGKARGDLVVFIDADLANLSEGHIETLLSPVLDGEADVVLGYLKRGEMPNLAAPLTGQRVYYRKDLLPHLERIAPSRFGVEVLLNDLFRDRRVKMVALRNLAGLTKVEKRKPMQALREYAKEAIEISAQLFTGKVPVLRVLFPSLNRLSDLVKGS